MRFAVRTFGCKVNQYESDAVTAAMVGSGFEKTALIENADLVIINSCTVTGKSDDKASRELRTIKGRYPHILLVLMGCFPQAYPEKAAALPADIIIGTEGKQKLPVLIHEYLDRREKTAAVKPHSDKFEHFSVYPKSHNTRAYLKIEDGCDRFCAYCIIPAARGRVRSRELSDIITEASLISEAGTREIVLTGINLSCYGKDLGLTLFDAVTAVASLPGQLRVRLSSLEPDLLTGEEITKLSAIKNFCPHFHLSLQSGCDDTLKRMKRRYTTEDFFRLTEKIRASFPNPGITTDIMVGFPGETDKEFQESLAFAQKAAFSKIHVFSYSLREGTAAATFSNQIPEAVKRERYNIMSKLAQAAERDFFNSQKGKTCQIIAERITSPEFLTGHAENYTPIRIYVPPGHGYFRGNLLKVRITAAENGHCLAEPAADM